MKKLIILSILILSFSSSKSINLDSLYSNWENKSLPNSTRIASFGKYIAAGYLYSNPDSALILTNKLLAFAEEKKNERGISSAINLLGNIHFGRGDYVKALEYFERNLNMREKLANSSELSSIYNNIGNVYASQEDIDLAIVYYKKGLEHFKKEGNKVGTAGLLNNIGALYNSNNQFEIALEYFKRSLKISEEINHKPGLARTYNSLGLYYRHNNNQPKAKEYFQKSIELNKDINNNSGYANSLNNLGTVYNKTTEYYRAIEVCKEGLAVSIKINSPEYERNACNCLYEANKGLGNRKLALEYHERMFKLDESIRSSEIQKNLQQMEFQKQIVADSLRQNQKELELKLAFEKQLNNENQKRNIAIGSGLLLLVIAVSLYFRNKSIKKSRNDISKEKERSEALLLNILPEKIATELKENGKSEAKSYDLISVLFTDFKEFTQISEELSATELVSEINTCFEAFDNICTKYGIEKIKTIGDSYMAAGGLPVPYEESIRNTVLAGIEMLQFINNRKTERENAGKYPFEMRVGINTGHVVAGIVGVKKFQYDIWGDTVNTASRMESAGEVGKVNISHSTYELLKDDPDFTFEHRGKVQAKGKGEVDMYFVEKVNK
jgi:class 3 adenylate cyclase/Tfp pilus assembly protein PilF